MTDELMIQEKISNNRLNFIGLTKFMYLRNSSICYNVAITHLQKYEPGFICITTYFVHGLSDTRHEVCHLAHSRRQKSFCQRKDIDRTVSC